MPLQHVAIRRVGGGMLVTAREEPFRPAHEELVERVVRSDEHREGIAATPSRPPRLLPRRCHGSGIPGHHDRIHPPDVDSQLQRVRGGHADQISIEKAPFDFPTLARRVTGPIAHDPPCRLLGRKGRLQRGPCVGEQQFGGFPRPRKGYRAYTGGNKRGKQIGGFGMARPTSHSGCSPFRRVPKEERTPAGGSSVVRDDFEIGRRAGQGPQMLRRIGDGGRAPHPLRMRTVPSRQSVQATQDVADMPTENPAVNMRFVDHHVPQVA